MPTEAQNATSKLTDASLALLGLLLGFTFAMALSKHELRRGLVVADSNALADFYNAAQMVKEPVRSQLQDAIRQCVDLRIQAVGVAENTQALNAVLDKTRALEGRMVGLVAEAADEKTPAAIPLIMTVNAMSSNGATRLAAGRDRLPAVVLALLFMAATIATLLEGRQQTLNRRTDAVGTLSFIVLATLAVYVILDLNQPVSGLIRTDQQSFELLRASIAK